MKPDVKATLNCGSAIRYFHQRAGTIENILGLEEAGKIDGIQQISIVHGVGERITEIVESGSRMGFVIAQGKDADDASQKCEEALSKIRIEETDYAD